jgi:uncharacterized protein with ParB-like and HNH nuclease domain
MDNGRLSLDSIFTGRNLFYIPNYQRGYAWEDKQITDFYEDFKTEYFSENYYYGTILLQKIGKEGNKEKYEIVDGQQRFTTLVVFLNCLISRLKDFDQQDCNPDDLLARFVKNKGLYILSIQSEDNSFFTSCILDGNPIVELQTPSQKKLLSAKKRFDDNLRTCSEKQILSFIDKILSTEVLVYLINNSKEAAMIFETTNDRGKPLTNLEKTKSYLMYKAAVGISEPAQLIERIQERFKFIYRDFSDIEQFIRDENAILQYCFIAYEEWTNKGKQKGYQHYMEHMKEKADTFIQEGSKEAFQNYIDQYTLDIQQSFSAIKKMFKSNYLEFQDIISLGRVANFLPLLLKCYRKDGTSDKTQFKKICRLCEIFSFRVYAILEYKTTKAQSIWYEMAKNFKGDFYDLEGTIVKLIKSVKTDEDFINKLSRSDFFTTYSSQDRNYFFWKYENYLRDNEQPVATPMSHQDLNEKKDTRLTLTIEHIVAQRNSEEQSRVVSPKLPINVGSAKKFNNDYLHSIGNLTIDPQSANSSKGRSNVATKTSKFFILAPYKCQNELTSFLVGQKWTTESIEKRKNKLLQFAKKTWCDLSKFNNTSDAVNLPLQEEAEVDTDLET